MLNPRTTFNFLLTAALLLLAACSKDGGGTGVDMSTVTDVAPVPTYTAEKYLQEAENGGINKGHPVFGQFPEITERSIVLFNGREIKIPETMTGEEMSKTRWAMHNFNEAEFKEIDAACRREKRRKFVNIPTKGADDFRNFGASTLDLPKPINRLCRSAGSVVSGRVTPYKK